MTGPVVALDAARHQRRRMNTYKAMLKDTADLLTLVKDKIACEESREAVVAQIVAITLVVSDGWVS